MIKTITESENGTKLDAAVGRAFPGMSRRLARQAILSGAVKLNGRVVKIFARNVKTGDVLTLGEAIATAKVASRSALHIVHEDDDLLVIDKPARLLSERVEGERGTAVADVLREQGLGRIWLVHRLDAGTSGVMMVARNERAAEALSDAFREGQVEKSYLLLCARTPGEGAYAGALGRDPAHPRRFALRREGKRALTRYRTLASSGAYALANARPETGRTHQIRVHFASAGHPLLGDKLYGGATKAQGRELLLLDRPMLHAWALGFTHPRTGKPLRFVLQPHEDMSRGIEVLDLRVDFDGLDPLW